MSWEDDEEEEGGSEAWRPSLFVFFILRSKVPFSSTSMSGSCRVHRHRCWTQLSRKDGSGRVRGPWDRVPWTRCRGSLDAPSSGWTG